MPTERASRRRIRRRPIVRHSIAATVAAALATACGPPGRPHAPAIAAPNAHTTGPPSALARGRVIEKRLSFSVLEDYDKGEDLREVARDFALMRELGVTTWRGSFGWDDYEPVRGRYEFEWLHQFADLAAREGIDLRPYIGYTPAWAGGGGTDRNAWNDPPARVEDWYAFVHALVSALRRHPNIRSYEIYNEENVRQWWDGTPAQYNVVLARGAAAIRDADPTVQVLLGGLVWPDVDFLEAACVTYGNARAFDVVPIHAYPETWTPDSVTVENYLGSGFTRSFVALVDAKCGAKPIWINETGFATVPGKTEDQQAEWWARAIATFAAEPRVEHIGIYEIRDLRTDSPVIGDQPNYHLGLTRVDRTKKLAFRTVGLLADLLGTGTITVADAELAVKVTAGRTGSLYHHLFERPDGRQVLVAWDRTGAPTLELGLTIPGARAVEHSLDGTEHPYSAFEGRTLSDVRLAPGRVRIFEIRP